MEEVGPPLTHPLVRGDKMSQCNLTAADLVSCSPQVLTSFDGSSMVSKESWLRIGERISLESVQMERCSDEVPSVSSGLTNQPWHASLEGFREFRSSPACLDASPSEPAMSGLERPEITTKFLSQNGYFDMPLMQAAEQLGYSAGSLKRVCRKLGLARWPYRVRKSLRSVIAKTEEFMEETDESGVSNSKSSVLGALKAQMDDVMGIAGQGIDEGTRKYRQAIFKLNHKISKKVSGQRNSRAKIKVPAAAAAQIALSAKGARRSSSSPSLCSEGDEGTLTGHHDLALRPSARLSQIATLSEQPSLGRARSPFNPQEGTTPESRAHMRLWSSSHTLGSGRPSTSSLQGSMEDIQEGFLRPSLSDPAPLHTRRSGIDLRRRALQARADDDAHSVEPLRQRAADASLVCDPGVLRLLEPNRSRSLPGMHDSDFRARLQKSWRFQEGHPPRSPLGFPRYLEGQHLLQAPVGAQGPAPMGFLPHAKAISLPDFSFTRRNAGEWHGTSSLTHSKEPQTQPDWQGPSIKVEPGRVYRGVPVPEHQGQSLPAQRYEWQPQHPPQMNPFAGTLRASGSSLGSQDSFGPISQEQGSLLPGAGWSSFSQAMPLPSAARAMRVAPSFVAGKPNVLDTLSGVLPGPVVVNTSAPATWGHVQHSEALPPLPHDESDMMDLISDLGLF